MHLDNSNQKFKGKYRVDSNRLKGYDYSRDGGYFLTICAKNQQCLFGQIKNEEMHLNELGRIVMDCWQEISDHFPNVILDDFVLMPNHIHGIIFIDNKNIATTTTTVETKNFLCNNVETKNFLSLRHHHHQHHHQHQKRPCGTSRTVGSVVRGFKVGVTKWARNNTDIYNVWQVNYYDHIIRNNESLNKIRQYIRNNPLRWDLDRNNGNGILM